MRKAKEKFNLVLAVKFVRKYYLNFSIAFLVIAILYALVIKHRFQTVYTFEKYRGYESGIHKLSPESTCLEIHKKCLNRTKSFAELKENCDTLRDNRHNGF
eukprot:snap_masked-scaffold_33-processed-gene-2.33-mRNA-1 protein AED:1.00 eAED:1.00 QI:0/-1/0/0/-1/1/1/0/100